MRTIILSLLIFSFSGMADSPTDKIVFIGDSLTEGYGVAKDKAYPALIQKKLLKAGKKWMVVNAGISGSTSSSAKTRVAWQLKMKPKLIILALGANDGLRGLPVKDLEKNLSDAVQLAVDAHVKIILAGMKMPPNYGKDYGVQFAAVYPRVAGKFKITLIPFVLEGVGGHEDLNQSDGIHPNEKGHEIVANTVYKYILEAL